MMADAIAQFSFLRREVVLLTGKRMRKTSLLWLGAWGCSSAGRAPALQAGSQEFESPQLHQLKTGL
jgi:hypothetical protein